MLPGLADVRFSHWTGIGFAEVSIMPNPCFIPSRIKSLSMSSPSSSSQAVKHRLDCELIFWLGVGHCRMPLVTPWLGTLVGIPR